MGQNKESMTNEGSILQGGNKGDCLIAPSRSSLDALKMLCRKFPQRKLLPWCICPFKNDAYRPVYNLCQKQLGAVILWIACYELMKSISIRCNSSLSKSSVGGTEPSKQYFLRRWWYVKLYLPLQVKTTPKDKIPLLRSKPPHPPPPPPPLHNVSDASQCKNHRQ